MIDSKKNILLFILCFLTLFSVAQQIKTVSAPDSYRAIHWTKDEGLPLSPTHTIFKDASGFLWVGSNGSGPCRFNGAVFKRYIPGQTKRGAINSGTIITFKEDSLHNIWMGTGLGISRYDMEADTFTNFSCFLDSAELTIAPFWATKDEMYCMEPDGVITAINIHTLKREKILQLSKTGYPGIEANTFNANKSFFDKSSKSFWFLSGGRRLEQIFPDGRVQFYTWPSWPSYEGKPNRVHTGNDAEDMCYDPDRNSVWINSGEGLLEFSLANKQFRKIEAWSKLTKEKSYDRGVGVDIDRQGRVWFSTYAEGIFIYNPETEQAKPAFSDHDTQLKTGEANLHIYCDRDGIVWTTDWLGNGIYALLPFNPPVKRYAVNPSAKNTLSSGLISTIVPGPQGKLWLGTKDGLNIFDPVTETFEVLRVKDLPGIKGTSILPLYIDTIRQKAWLNAGSQETEQQYFGMSMYEMDIKTRKCSRIVFMDRSKRIDTFYAQYHLVRPYKNGIIFCDEKHGVFEIKEGSLVANLLIPLVLPRGESLGNILLVEDRYLFLDHGSAIHNFAFENKNGKWTKVPNQLDNRGWYSALYNKKDQTYWVSESEKLVHYNKEFRVIKAYSVEDGYNAPMLTMQFDNYGNLWFANMSAQIGRFSTATGIFSKLSETDGYQKMEFDWGVPITKDVRGDLYFGIGAKWGTGDLNWGLDRVYPERFSSGTSAVYLSALSINQKPFSLYTQVNEFGKLSLKYNQNSITIQAGIIDYYSRKGKIRYKLGQNGKEGDWQYPPDHIIRYESLSPGSYQLVVQSSNINDEFNSLEKTLMINISPAFWNTWWFRSLVISVLIAVVYATVQYRSRNLKKQNIELEEKVMHRTKELKHSLEELKSTQAQLIQSEKMASLGELTAGIAHEIQNPLNFVNNFSDVSNELIEEMNTELDKGDIDEAKAIASDIKQNLEKINHHGKRADAIVKGMLQHSRVSTGQKELTDINALCDEYLRLSYHGLRAKDKEFNATMKTDFDESLSADKAGIGSISIIPQDIGRGLLNLYNNAFYAVTEKKKQAGDNYEPIVSVSTKKIGDRIEIKVADNGNGIPQKVVDKIFQPFFTTKPTGQGTGLGLSLSYDIIKAHGGEIKVETKEGEFTEFVIRLPLAV